MVNINYKSIFIILFFIVTTHLITYPTNCYSESIDQQVRDISSELMCPVCSGQSVSESNAQLAKDMRATIKRQLEQGKSKEQILSYFVDRYGETVLSSPPAKGFNIIIWIIPTFGILIVGLILGTFVYKSKIQSKTKTKDEGLQNSEFNDIENELKNYDL